MYRQFKIQQFYVLPTQCICVLCGSENKLRLFPYIALPDWYNNRDRQCLLRGTDWVFVYNSGVAQYSNIRMCQMLCCTLHTQIGIKQDALALLLYSFALKYTVTEKPAFQEALQRNGPLSASGL
jgi:hypothetical protein